MNILKSIFDRALFYISVPKCVSCERILNYGEKALCSECYRNYLNDIDRECSRCNKKLNQCHCSNFYLERHNVRSVIKVYRYNSKNQDLPGNKLIYSLKQDNREDVFDFLAAELSMAICNSYPILGEESKYIITNVPRRSVAIRNYGYDHSAELAVRVAKLLGVEYRSMLTSLTVKAQKEVIGDERRKNASFSIKRNAADVNGRIIFLIDDVVTTGSSMAACARALKTLHSKMIIGASVSIAYKDSYIKPEFQSGR